MYRNKYKDPHNSLAACPVQPQFCQFDYIWSISQIFEFLHTIFDTCLAMDPRDSFAAALWGEPMGCQKAPRYWHGHGNQQANAANWVATHYPQVVDGNDWRIFPNFCWIFS